MAKITDGNFFWSQTSSVLWNDYPFVEICPVTQCVIDSKDNFVLRIYFFKPGWLLSVDVVEWGSGSSRLVTMAMDPRSVMVMEPRSDDDDDLVLDVDAMTSRCFLRT